MESREDGLCKSNPILIKGGDIKNFSEIPGILISTFHFLNVFLGASRLYGDSRENGKVQEEI